MDISAYLASVQDNPQSAMLARSVMQPGIPSPDGSSPAPDMGAPPQPTWDDQSQPQDTGPVTGGFDQSQMGMDAPTPAPMQDMGAPPQQQQQEYAPPQMDMSALDAGGSSAQDFTQDSSDEGYARGGMVSRAPRMRRPRQPKQQQGGGAGGSGLWHGETPDENQPAGTIADFGMYDKNHNLLGITDLGITRDEVMGTTNKNVDAGMWEGAGPAGDSSGAGSGGVGGGNLPMGAEGGSVDEMVELSDDKGDDQYARLPNSENVDDRRGKDSLDMNAAQAADVTGAPLGYGMLKGTPYRQAKADYEVAPKRPLLWDDPANDLASTSRPIPKFEDAGPVDEAIAPAIPEMPPEGDAPGIPTKESVNAEGMPDTGIAPAVDAGFKVIYNQAGVNAGVPTPQVQHSAEQMFKGKGATPPNQAEAAIEANGGNSGKTVKAVYDFFNAGKDASKDLTALHDYASDKIDPNPTPGHGRSDFEEMGAQAAAGMLQHIRTRFNQTAALATAAPTPEKKGEAASLAFNKYVPDGSEVQVVPTGNGYNVSVDGKNTPVSPQQLDHMLATPFDVIAHMGVKQTLASLQNVNQLQHMSGQPQQPTGDNLSPVTQGGKHYNELPPEQAPPPKPLDASVPGNEFANPSQRFPQIKGAPLNKDGKFDQSAPHDWRPEIQSHEQSQRTRGQVPGMPKGYKNPNADYSQVTKEDRRSWGTADAGRYGNAGVLTNDQANNLIYKLQKQGASDDQIKQEIARVGGARPSTGISVQSGGSRQLTYGNPDSSGKLSVTSDVDEMRDRPHKNAMELEGVKHTEPAKVAAQGRVQQEQIRQQGLNKRAEDSSTSPHGREAQLKMQRERQALTAANAEIKAAENEGKPVDRAAVYKKYGLEHLLAGAGGQAASGGAPPKDGEIRVINGRKMRADVKRGGWVPAE